MRTSMPEMQNKMDRVFSISLFWVDHGRHRLLLLHGPLRDELGGRRLPKR